MLVDNDAAAEMLPAPVLAVEEWHGLLSGARKVEEEGPVVCAKVARRMD